MIASGILALILCRLLHSMVLAEGNEEHIYPSRCLPRNVGS